MKRSPKSSQRAYPARRSVTLSLFIWGVACLAGIETPYAFAHTEVPGATARTITFTERVAYQYAIDEIYWRHRIWPKDNPGPKPPLDAMVSEPQIENKVEDYLRKSQIVSDKRGSAITPRELQAEIDRMAAHTKQPEVLRELFAALGNDPFVIAECLARPILAEQLLRELAAEHGIEVLAATNASMSGRSASTSYAYTLPETSPLDCVDDTWTATSVVNAPDARGGHTAVWTGSEMIIWGGGNISSGQLNTGAKYYPATDNWTATAIANAPLGRAAHTAVWTGAQMIVWGGHNNLAGPVNTGGRYNPITDSWTATSTANTPTARESHTAVWIGTEMIVWGGRDNAVWMNSGGRYNPNTDSWTPTSTTTAPSARWNHTALWVGSEMIIWGGTDQTNYLHTGGKYSPTTDSWTPTGLMNVAPGRVHHTAVWTGSEMLVWGGVDENFNDTNTGGRYNPTTDSWTATNFGNAPLPRDSHSAIWTGSDMIVWGGHRYPPGEVFNSGGRYNPNTDTWRAATTTVNAPDAREYHSAVWTGSEMIVWGGWDINAIELNTGGRYCAQPTTPIAEQIVSRKSHGSAGSFDILLPLNGTPGIECRSGDGTNDYTLVVTFLANVSVNGDPQAAVTAGIGTIGSGGVSNGGRVTITGSIVTIPLTNAANAQTVQVTLYGVNGSTNFTIPMSILVGDINGNGTVNASDVSQTKSRIGQQIHATNFRSDVSANGYIDAVDVALVKSRLGTGLP